MENKNDKRPIRVVVRLSDILDIVASRLIEQQMLNKKHSDIEDQVAHWIDLNLDLKGVDPKTLAEIIQQRVWTAKIRGYRVDNIKVSVLL